MSRLRNHFAKCQARHAAGAEPEVATSTIGEITLVQLAAHRRALKAIKSMTAKIEAKRPMVLEYEGYIDGVIGADAGGSDDVISLLMLWHIDISNFDRAIQIGAYAVKHGLPMPNGQKRTAAEALAEQFAEGYLTSADDAGRPTRTQLHDVLGLVAQKDMHDEIGAKLHKVLGDALNSENDIDGALLQFKEALRLNPNVGVKSVIKALEKNILDRQ